MLSMRMHPDGQKYYTLDELKEETDKLGEKLNANELDKKIV